MLETKAKKIWEIERDMSLGFFSTGWIGRPHKKKIFKQSLKEGDSAIHVT